MSISAASLPHAQSHLRVIFILAAVLLAAILAAGVVLFSMAPPYQVLGQKLIEVVAQTIAVTFAGGLLVQAYLKWHSREQAVNEFRRALLDGLIKQYMATKSIRRLLRAASVQDGSGSDVNPWTGVPAATYHEAMKQLNMVELELEVLGQRVEIFAAVFPQASVMGVCFNKMVSYLDTIITEYERHQAVTDADADMVPIRKHAALGGFVLRKQLSQFSEFANPYHALLKSLQGGAVRVAL